jgi:glucokinase
VSGAGLVNIYEFLRTKNPASVCAQIKDAPPTADLAALISECALEHNDPLANQALDLFCSVYGAQAGNLALTCLAGGGVYVAGGIAPKIIAKLKEGCFLRAFRNKGRMAPLLDAMPVRIIMNPKVGVIGAALVASRLVSGK